MILYFLLKTIFLLSNNCQGPFSWFLKFRSVLFYSFQTSLIIQNPIRFPNYPHPAFFIPSFQALAVFRVCLQFSSLNRKFHKFGLSEWRNVSCTDSTECTDTLNSNIRNPSQRLRMDFIGRGASARMSHTPKYSY